MPVPVADHGLLLPGEPRPLRCLRGRLALDGEREIELNGREPASVTLELDGPRTLDVRATLAAAVRHGALRRPLAAEMPA